MNFSVLDGYFDVTSSDVNSSEDTDASNQGYKPPATQPNEPIKLIPITSQSQILSQFNGINQNKEIVTLRAESDKIRKQLRHLYQLRSSKYKSITNEISKSYQQMHLRKAQITKQFGQTQLSIINWRILFEQKYLSEIKSLMTHFDSFKYDSQKQQKQINNNDTTHPDNNIYPSSSAPPPNTNNKASNINIPVLPEEAPSSGDNEPLFAADNEKKYNTPDAEVVDKNNIKLDELSNRRIKVKINSINNSDNSLTQRYNSINRPKSRYSMEKNKRNLHKKYTDIKDITAYLIEYRSNLEKEMNAEQKNLKSLCKNLRLELKNEQYLQQRQELLISYEERIGIVLILFHWFIETNKYELKSNVYSHNNIGHQLSGQKMKHYYLCNNIITQIQNKFDCLVLDARNEIGKNIRQWFQILSRKDIRHLKASILLKHINCFIRDFIKSYHYIINDIVRNQNGKYNIEYVIKKHHSVNEIQFKQYITSKTFLCKKNQTTQYYYKQELTAVALRWTLLRLLQRCIYSRLSIIGILPKIHSLGNNPYTLSIVTDTKINNMSLNSALNNSAKLNPSKSNVLLQVNQNEGDSDNLFDEEEHKKVYIKKRRSKRKPMAMQMVTLDNSKSATDMSDNDDLLFHHKICRPRASSFDDSVLSINYVEKDAEEEEKYETCTCTGTSSNIEYITLPDKHSGTATVIQYAEKKVEAKKHNFGVPTFSIYGLPRNSDYEFELLDQHFFNQCGWMRHLSPFQLGIEEIYWCDTPPLNLHANSDILLNVKESLTSVQLKNKLMRCNSNVNDEAASSLSDSCSSQRRNSVKHRSSVTVTLTKGIARHKDIYKEDVEEEEKEVKLYEIRKNVYRSKSRMCMRRMACTDQEEKDEFSYDYTVKPYGDALALIECLDELTAPHDMNECLGYVVDVIFRTAQTYRKFNIHKQTKMERYHLDLSSLTYKHNNKNEEDENVNSNLKKKKKKKKKKRKKSKNKSKLLPNGLQDSLTTINGEAAIGADVFFPLFIWAIVHSKIRNIHRAVFIMSHYNDSDAMKTKVGYNVSTLHSALDHIMKADRKLYVKQNFRR